MHLPKHRRHERGSDIGSDVDEIGGEDLSELSKVLAAPPWLKDVGRTSWLLLGLFGVIAGLTWLLGATSTIVGPFVAATIIATVVMPIVSALVRHMPRVAAAVLVLLGLLALGVLVLLMVISGLKGQSQEIGATAGQAADKAQGWATSVGVDESGAQSADATVKASAPEIISALAKGVINGISGLTSLLFSLSLALLSLFFLLKDGPVLRAAIDRHLGVPQPVAHTITSGVITSLRGYFRGVTIVGLFNAVVVGLGAWALGVPLAGTIAVVTFVLAYVPYIGAFVSGAFAVVLALGSEGTTTALAMLVIVLLANGLLQNIFQPFAMGAALDLHPLITLVVTIAAGCVFGMLGLILAAPLVSAAVHITADLGRARAQHESEAAPAHAAPGLPEPTAAG